MNRYIKLNDENQVINIRYGATIVEGEIQSVDGEIGQIMQEDGSFVDPEPPEPVEPLLSLQEQIYAENLYQTALLEMQNMLGGM